MNDKNAFDRQLDREIDYLAGPEPNFDAAEVVSKATQSGPHWHLSSLFGTTRLAAVVAVVALFGALLLFSGILDSSPDTDTVPVVGASPSASPRPGATEPAGVVELPPEEVTYATGTMQELFGSFLSQDVPGSTANLAGPRWFEVRSSDPRLNGEATLLVLEDGWGGDWGISLYYGRMEIENEDGIWAGTVGPHVEANAPDAAESLSRFGPTVLTGAGAWDGHTAYIHFTYDEPTADEAENPDWFEEGSGMEGQFEAVVVNRTTPGFPSDDIWLREMRRTGQVE